MLERDISIIVPIYNAEKYLDDCVQSVLEQTYVNFELILIDDGSTDGSRKLCEKWCEKDERVRCIDQKHQGVSAARNTGIEEAVGKYLFFLDSDDFIHPQLLEALYRLQEENRTNIATVGFHCIREDEERNSIDCKMEEICVRDSCYLKYDKAMKPKLFASVTTRLNAIGGKLILRKAIQTVRFDEKISNGEDTLFLFRIIANGADVTVLFRDWYYYRRAMEDRKKAESIASFRNKYKVLSYIRDYDIENNRMTDAKGMEWILLCEMVKWNRGIEQIDNPEWKEYMERLIAAEKRLWIFSRIDLFRKTVFCIGCVYYPLYGMLEKIRRWSFRIVRWIYIRGRKILRKF